jgi:hypothetical protein
VRIRCVVVALVVSALALAGCGGGGGSDEASPSTTAPTTAPPATLVPGQCTGFRGALDQVTSTGDVAPASLIDATAGAEGCLDIVTFTLQSKGDGTPPGYDVGYRDVEKDPIMQGDPPEAITVPGNAHLMVAIKPALSTDPSVPDNPQTYTGNLSLSYDTHNHLEIVEKLDDGPDTVNWVIGLDSVRPFRVDRSQDLTTPGVVRVSILIG